MAEATAHESAGSVQIPEVQTISPAQLLTSVQDLAGRGLRFVTATCLDAQESYEVYYHFADGEHLSHLRVVVSKGSTLPSISGIYMCAFLVENEIQELFGLEITDIVIDYKGHLLLTDGGPVTPMLKQAAATG